MNKHWFYFSRQWWVIEAGGSEPESLPTTEVWAKLSNCFFFFLSLSHFSSFYFFIATNQYISCTPIRTNLLQGPQLVGSRTKWNFCQYWNMINCSITIKVGVNRSWISAMLVTLGIAVDLSFHAAAPIGAPFFGGIFSVFNHPFSGLPEQSASQISDVRT